MKTKFWDVTYKSPNGSIGKANAVEALDEDHAKYMAKVWLAAGGKGVYDTVDDFIILKAEKSIHNPRPLNNL